MVTKRQVSSCYNYQLISFLAYIHQIMPSTVDSSSRRPSIGLGLNSLITTGLRGRVRVTSHFNGKLQNLTPRISQTPNFYTPKFAQMIMSSMSPDVQNLVKNSLTGGFPTNRWYITLAWLFVPFLPFPFLLFFCRPLQEKRLNWF